MAGHSFNGNVFLYPLAADSFYATANYFGQLDFVFNKDVETTRFYYQDRTWKIQENRLNYSQGSKLWHRHCISMLMLRFLIKSLFLFLPLFAFGQKVGIHHLQRCDSAVGIKLGLVPDRIVYGCHAQTSGLRVELLGSVYAGSHGCRDGDYDTYLQLKDSISTGHWNVHNGLNISTLGTAGSIRLNGLTLGGFGNTFHSVRGGQMALVSNVCASRLLGFQASLIDNKAIIANGIQMSSRNKSVQLNGLQFGWLNRTIELRGVQLGLVNRSVDAKGIQIGLWNVINHRGFPFINFKFHKTF